MKLSSPNEGNLNASRVQLKQYMIKSPERMGNYCFIKDILLFDPIVCNIIDKI